MKLITPKADSTEAPLSIDLAIKQLRELRRANERQLTSCKNLIFEIKTKLPSGSDPNVDVLRKVYELAEEQLLVTRKSFEDAEQKAVKARLAQIEHRENHKELITLAQLALRHLGETCPVCGQKHDIENTRRRLEELLNSSPEPPVIINNDDVLKIAANLEQQEKICNYAKAKVNAVENKEQEYRSWLIARDSLLKQMGVYSNQATEILQKLMALDIELDKKNEEISDLEQYGERLALTLTQISELARRSELEQQVAKTRYEMQNLEKEILERRKTGDLSTKILGGLRDATYFVVEEQLKNIEPILRGIYAMIDPHPVFKDVRFVTRFVRGRGRLNTTIDDRYLDLSSEFPWAVLSSSQVNALAVAVFLSFNLGMPALPIETAMLDDPIQSLDDVNLLGLVDLMRRTKDRRQLIVSTHDIRYYHLLQRKLRPINESQRTITIEFGGWSRSGPGCRVEDVAPDLEPMRIAVS